MATKPLKLYFWISVFLAAFSIATLPFLMADGTASPLFAGWVIMGHTLLFPTHGFLYDYRIPTAWFWPISIPVIIVLGVASIFGFIQIGDSVRFNLPALDIWSFFELAIHAPMFAMATLYLIKNRNLSEHKPEDSAAARS